MSVPATTALKSRLLDNASVRGVVQNSKTGSQFENNILLIVNYVLELIVF